MYHPVGRRRLLWFLSDSLELRVAFIGFPYFSKGVEAQGQLVVKLDFDGTARNP